MSIPDWWGDDAKKIVRDRQNITEKNNKNKSEYDMFLDTLSSSERTKRLRYNKEMEDRGYSNI